MNKQQRLVIVSLIIMFSVIPAYKVKSRLGVNILPGGHTPDLLEHLTGGLFKARWVDRNYVQRPHFDWKSWWNQG